MTSGQPTDVAEQGRPEESTQQQPQNSQGMKLDEQSVALLSAIKKLFPLLMPQKVRLRMIDKISLHGTLVTQERGDVTVSIDDILIGMHQSLPPRLVEMMCSKLKISPEKKSEYRQKALERDHVSMEAFLADLKVHAEKCGAQICEEKLQPILDCYKDIVERDSVYLKTTTKPVTPRELFVRAGHAAKWFELAAMAKAAGIIDLYDNPAYKAYLSVCDKVDVIGSIADISVEGEIQKFYGFFVQKPEAMNTLRACKNLPPSIFRNADLLESWGLKRFSIFGVDFRNSSLNLYYYLDQTGFNRAKIETMLTSLGFPLPSEEILEQMKGAAIVYFTFTFASDRIERVCFTKIYEDDMEPVAQLAPAFRDYVENAPLKSAKRDLLLGFAFNKKGHYLKLELDYKASMQLPKIMKYTGLYSDPNEF